MWNVTNPFLLAKQKYNFMVMYFMNVTLEIFVAAWLRTLHFWAVSTGNRFPVFWNFCGSAVEDSALLGCVYRKLVPSVLKFLWQRGWGLCTSGLCLQEIGSQCFEIFVAVWLRTVHFWAVSTGNWFLAFWNFCGSVVEDSALLGCVYRKLVPSILKFLWQCGCGLCTSGLCLQVIGSQCFEIFVAVWLRTLPFWTVSTGNWFPVFLTNVMNWL